MELIFQVLTKSESKSKQIEDSNFYSMLRNVKEGNLNEVQKAVSNGIDITSHGNQAVLVAAHQGNFEMVKYLVNQGADLDLVLGRATGDFKQELESISKPIFESLHTP